tara:strand:- start:325 stop:618 length:294 start_codon:yes stop_codon:yes gene_type:complete
VPIERKDRSFDKIFDEITLDKIPMDFIHTVKITFTDGSIQELTGTELTNLNSEHDILKRFENEGVLDVAIQLDYPGIKSEVQNEVKGVLDQFFKDPE